MLVTGRSALGLVPPVLDALAAQLDETPPVVRVVNLRDAPKGQLRAVDAIRGVDHPLIKSGGVFEVRESGFRYEVDLGLARPTHPRPACGLYLDQRENRARVADAVTPGSRWLNLFCHTGAFSVTALAAGAAHVTSVDLSASYLAWLERNLSLNGLDDARHLTIKRDARRFLESEVDAPFDGIIFDPPTAAAAGKRFWSVKKEAGAILQRCLEHLKPGGVLLASSNVRRKRGTLLGEIEKASARVGRLLTRVEPAPPGVDFPRLEGFPEGDSFEGVWVEV